MAENIRERALAYLALADAATPGPCGVNIDHWGSNRATGVWHGKFCINPEAFPPNDAAFIAASHEAAALIRALLERTSQPTPSRDGVCGSEQDDEDSYRERMECRDAVLEEAAKVCDGVAERIESANTHRGRVTQVAQYAAEQAERCAAAIRALKRQGE